MIDTRTYYDTVTVFDTTFVNDTIHVVKYIANPNNENWGLYANIASVIVGIGAIISIISFVVELGRNRIKYFEYLNFTVEPKESKKDDGKLMITAKEYQKASFQGNIDNVIKAFEKSTYRFRTIQGLKVSTGLEEIVIRKILNKLLEEHKVRKIKSKGRELWSLTIYP